MTTKLILTYKSRDSWDRPVYECEGRLYVDVDPRTHRIPEIYTKQFNAFNGEPLDHIAKNVEIEFVPERETWH